MEKQELKKTEIGGILKEWEARRTDQVLTFKNGERPKNNNGLFPIYGANGIMGYTSKFLINNDFVIIIGRVGASGEVHIAEGKIWVSDNAIYSSSYDFEKIYIPFIFYLLKFINLRQYSTKTTHPIITQSFLNSLLITIPPVPEQKKIAEILSTVDQTIEEVDKSITKTERLKKGLMQELLIEGIGHKEFKETEIGKIPKEWHMTKLGNIIKQKNEAVTPSSIKLTRYIGLEHIKSGDNKIRLWGNSSEVKSIKFQFKAGDILFGKLRSYLDKVAIAEWNGVCSTDILVFEVNKGINNLYILYLMHHPHTLLYAITTSTGTNHPRTSWRMLSRLKVSLPPLPEQNKIAEILFTVEERIQLLKEKKNKLERVKKGLMNELLTGRKRVKVEV